MACYTGTIFNATSLQIVSLKIVQCDITSDILRHFLTIVSHFSNNMINYIDDRTDFLLFLKGITGRMGLNGTDGRPGRTV